MRHSDIGLTMNVYTDPRLLDVAGAVERLPDLPLAAGDRTQTTAARATGTDAGAAGASPALPPKLPLPSEHSSKSLATAGNNPKADVEIQKRDNPQFSKENQGFSGDSASRGERIRTFDLLVPNQQARRSNLLTDQDVTETAAPACTAACTSEGENRNGGHVDRHQDSKSEGTAGTPPADALATLAAAISALAPGDRDRLAELLQKDGRK